MTVVFHHWAGAEWPLLPLPDAEFDRIVTEAPAVSAYPLYYRSSEPGARVWPECRPADGWITVRDT